MKIIAVFKTHFDIGFTDLSENVRKNFCNEMLERTFEVCEATSDRPDGKRYVWTVPSEPLQYALNSEYITEENRKRLISYIENGQMVWHALPFTVHSEFCGLNELIYGLNISEKLSKRFGRKTVSAKMTDVPGHTWFIPSLLNAAGVKFLHLGCNAGSTPPDVPPLFWWEGPDGSRVLTMYAKGGYGTDVLLPEGWKYPVWLAMTMTNDNIGPQTVEFIDEMEKRVSENRPDDELVFGTMDDFYYELEPFIDDIPVIKSDLADTWIHGVGTYPKQVREIRQNRRILAAMNNLYNLLSVIENTEYDLEFKQHCETALYNMLMFDEHTWGCDIKLYLKDRKYDKQEFLDWLEAGNAETAKLSWGEQIARVEKVNEAVNKVSEKLCAAVEESSDELIVYGNGSASGDYWIPVEKGAVYTDKQYGTPMTTFSGINGDELYLPILHNTEIRSYKKGFGISASQKNVSVKRDSENIVVSTPYHTAVFSARLGTLCGLTDNYDVKYIVDSEGIKTYGSNGVLHIATDAWMGYTFSEETVGANILAGKKYRLSFDYDVLTPGTNTNEWSIAMVEVKTDKEGDHNDYVTTAVPVSGSKTYEFVCTGNNNVYLAVNAGCEVVIDNIVLEEFVNYPFLGVQKRESNDEEGKVAELAYGMKLHAVDSAEYIYTMDGSAVEVEEKGFIAVLSNHIDGKLTLDINDPYVKVIKVTEAAEKVIDNGNLHNVYTLAITDPEADRSITVRSYVVGTDGNVYYGDAVIAAANDLASEAFNAWIGADITE